MLRGENPTVRIKPFDKNRFGKAEGVLLGGNLAVIAGLISTPFDVFRPGSILFIEDVAEPIYKVERILYTLKLNGSLEKLAGLIVGGFIMAINLSKGQKIDLTKTEPGLKNVFIGLGWDPVKKKGLFSRPQNIDCDASVIMLSGEGKVRNKEDVIFFNNLRHKSGSVIHKGDELTGGKTGDDEQIMVFLEKVPQEYQSLVFVVTIYQASERHQNFGMIENAFIRIVNADNNQELCRFNLSGSDYDGFKTMLFGELYRHNGEWKFNAMGNGIMEEGISAVTQKFV